MVANDSDILKTINGFRAVSRDIYEERREGMLENRRFRQGHQWKDEDRLELERKGRLALTINHTLPTAMFMQGTQRQNRRDMKSTHNVDSSEVTASILSNLMKHAHDRSDGDAIQSEAFKDALDTNRGWWELYEDNRRDLFNTELRLRKLDPLRVMEDPTADEYDLNESCRYVIIQDWQNKERVKLEYPEKSDELGEIVHGFESEEGFVGDMVAAVFGSEIDDEINRPYAESRYPVHRVYWKKPMKRGYIIDKPGVRTIEIDPNSEQAKAARRLIASGHERFDYVERIVDVLHYTVLVHNIILEHTVNPFDGIHTYPVFRFCPFWDDGEAMGFIDNLKGPQMELNKRRTQDLVLLNKAASGGWKVRSKDKTSAVDELEEYGSSPNTVFATDDFGGEIEPMPSLPAPTDNLTRANVAAEDIKAISNVHDSSRGFEQKGESGVLNEKRQRQGLTVNEPIFDNFDRTLKIYAQMLVDMIRHRNIYSLEEIRYLVDEEDLLDDAFVQQAKEEIEQLLPPPTPPDAAQILLLGEEMAALQHQAALEEHERQIEPLVRQLAIDLMMEEIKQWRKGHYDAAITQSLNSETVKINTFVELTAIIEKYPEIRPAAIDTLIKATSLPKSMKDELLDNINELKQAATTAA